MSRRDLSSSSSVAFVWSLVTIPAEEAARTISKKSGWSRDSPRWMRLASWTNPAASSTIFRKSSSGM